MSIKGIHQVQLEINNRCSYSHAHPKCPANLATEPKFLDSDIIYDILEYLGDKEYDGEVMFSIYNEPLEDPRLFGFLTFMKFETEKATPYVITNGRCLDQHLLDKLVEYGTRVIANGYTPEEAARLRTLKGGGKYTVREESLDQRMKMYERDDIDLALPCHAPKRNLAIWHTGEVGICCRDWKRTEVLGDLNEESFAEVLVGAQRVLAVDFLEAGNRTFCEVCRKCARVWK